MATFKIRGVYSFDVYPVPVIGNNFQNVTVVGIMDWEMANKEIDVMALHVQSYSFLPAGTPDNPQSYEYLKIKMPSGVTTIIAAPWINEATIQSNEYRTITATIGGVSASDLAPIKAALVQNGYNNVALSISN
jgi:hypothetical protein